MVKRTSIVTLLFGILLSSSAGYAQNLIIKDAEFIVDSDKEVVISHGTVVLLVDKFVMKDKSRLVISPPTPTFMIVAKQTLVGNGAQIVASGLDGPLGEDGFDGVDLTMFLGNASLQYLRVNTKGGSGGRGVKGKKGQRGRDASCSGRDAHNGGQGGRGGNGGKGGDGGNIKVYVSKDSKPLGLSLQADSGLGGDGGPGGEGGDGGAGKRRCGVWPYWSKGSGKKGSNGPFGSTGRDGEWGNVNIINIAEFKPDLALAELRLRKIMLEFLGSQDDSSPKDADINKKILQAIGVVE